MTNKAFQRLLNELAEHTRRRNQALLQLQQETLFRYNTPLDQLEQEEKYDLLVTNGEELDILTYEEAVREATGKDIPTYEV